MDLRDHITSETSAFAERLFAAADAASEKVRLEADAKLAALRGEVDEVRAQLESQRSRAADLAGQLEAVTARAAALASQLETESTRSDSLASELEQERARGAGLASDLEVAAASLRAAQDARAKSEAAFEAASTENRSLREMLQSARAEAIRASEGLEAEAAQKALLQQEHETTVATLQAQVEADASAITGLKAALARAADEAREAAAATELRVNELQQQLDAQSALLREKDARVETAEASVARMREEVTEANAITDAAGTEMTVLRGKVGRVTSMITAAATSLDALSAARTVAELFAILIRELSTEFARAAIFRVKGNHLEGDLAVGVDASVDIQKIVVPLGMSSVLTKAVSGGLQHATKEELGDSRPPFGGSPELVVAAPLVFDGEVLAVAYADADAVPTAAHVPVAALLVRHANAVLGAFAQELRTSRQLREYARTLLQEVEAMFAADVNASVPESSRLERLCANIGFARDLYAQRAALEAPLSTNLLDDEVGRMLRGAEPSSPFASAVADVVVAREEVSRKTVSAGRS
jgi:hypothetical protein